MSAGRIGPNSAVVRDWLADYVYETMRTETLEQVVDRLDSAIVARVPELADRDMSRDLAASTRAHARTMLSGLTSDTFELAIPEEAHAFARTIARRGFDLRLLLRTYHVGMEAVLDYMTDAVEQRDVPQEIERAVMLRLFDRSTKWVSMSVELLTETYMEERERVLRAALNRRTETVHALLSGEEMDGDQASIRLGYRLAQQHLAFVLWTDASEPGGDGESTGLLDRAAARVAGELGSAKLLTVPSGASGMWAWIGLEDAAHAADLAAPGRLARLLAGHVDAPVRVAFGVPAARAGGFRASHREAVAARHVAELAPGDGSRVTVYRDVEIAYLAGTDEAAMRGLIRRELRELAGSDANAVRLRRTLHAYLASHRSPEATAKLLGVHKNTVRYRIQRIEELLGHPIEQRSLPLEVALACVDAYGV
ncbi:DNA-binding transcriptional regulator, PucR family [Nocardia amikacinitolerans]|uniref:DNA-binding transcriptional regulator, PucR family n=1 Tax=Nocardia amikacinitolerans TaxID=756689 RepID=A0A285LXQ9_9NOCA|nr:helix-turn-helix domain-containing protein [Nocardia amikacinitolerans]MCP2299173.1 DNA-binding transcriptional regulator, PucR family [Nocardia amikacinitolerans]SNY88927.1 DNA-binding transcriptional regulator, PucR family [Nocardia amikacinitolerans]